MSSFKFSHFSKTFNPTQLQVPQAGVGGHAGTAFHGGFNEISEAFSALIINSMILGSAACAWDVSGDGAVEEPLSASPAGGFVMQIHPLQPRCPPWNQPGLSRAGPLGSTEHRWAFRAGGMRGEELSEVTEPQSNEANWELGI